MTRHVITILFFILCFSLSARAGEPFIFGVSQGSDEAVPLMEELGIRWGRISIAWNEVTPVLEGDLPCLREAMARPELVEQLSARTDWSAIDAKVRLRLDHGITPVPIVGSGWHSAYPKYKDAEAWPDRIGRDRYLAGIYLYTRAVVERYDGDGYLDAPGITLKLWQTENELNQAGLTAAWGWRKPEWFAGLAGAWNDFHFLTRVIRTLHRAVHDADPEARTIMNFHTDINPKMNHLLLQPDWMTAVVKWRDHMDLIGFDAYPNYYDPDPVRGEVVGERVKLLRELSSGKPVIAVEVDYPYGPAERGFTPAKQAEFLRTSFDSARAAGAAGYFKFRVCDPDQKVIELSEEDLHNLELVAPWYEEGKVGRLLWWALPRAGYIRDHFLDALKSVEGHWGVVTPTGERLPSYEVILEISREVNGG